MGVILTYNNSQILNLDDSGNKTIKTGGKYCEHDISLAFTKQPSGIACIYAAYPPGWICSCSNGQTAEDTSGEYLFFVEELGTYVVTATNGSISKQITVNVTTKWRSYDGSIPYSLIHVTYPVGWNCSCALGAQTQIAPDTSGDVTFVAISTGTYTISATNGTSTSQDTVNVNQFGRTYQKEILDKYYIYKDGTFMNGATTIRKASTGTDFNVANENGKIVLTRTATYDDGEAYIDKQIGLGTFKNHNFSKMCCHCDSIQRQIMFGLKDHNGGSYAHTYITISAQGDYSLDIADIQPIGTQGVYAYPTFLSSKSYGANEASFSSVWFEY